MENAKTKEKIPEEEKDGPRENVGLCEVVALQRRWREARQMMLSSECFWPRVRGRQRGVLRWIPHQAKASVDEPLGGSAMFCEVCLGRES